jgi:hypothetical protein
MASAATLSAALLLVPATAGAFVHGTFGLQQRKPVFLRPGPLQYHAGPVIHSSDSYAIYWDPLELYNSRWMATIDEYFQNVGTASNQGGDVFALNAQYGEQAYNTASGATAAAKEAHAANASTFRGAYTDTDPYPGEHCTEPAAVTCLTDQALKAELQKVIASGVLPGATGTVPGAKSTPIYYILTPPGVTVCAGTSEPKNCSNSTALEHESTEIAKKNINHPAETGICGYHSTVNPGSANPIVYAVQPWIAGDAGLLIEAESPLKTSETSADVLACQDRSEVLEEPNQTSGLDPFAEYGAGLADVVIGDLANEQSNVVVNPLLNAWYQNASPEEHGFPEQGDMCQWAFDRTAPGSPNETTHAGNTANETVGTGAYYLHWGYNSSGFFTGKPLVGCWQGATLEPHITAPNPVNVGDVIALDANESAITLAAAPLGPRQGREETRLSNEVNRLTSEETGLTNELVKLAADEGELPTDIIKLGEEETRLAGELVLLGEEAERVTENERKLTKQRKEAEAGSGITAGQEEEFAKTEARLIAERARITAAKAAAEKEKVTDGETKTADKAKLKADEERKPTIEADKVILAGDKGIANEEKTLATEHKIFETEPLLAPVYRWDFGYQENGHEVTEEGQEKASVFHAFPCAKTYHVNLTVEDGGGFEAQPAKATEIKVEGKPCEEAAPSSGAPSGPGGSTQTPPAASTGASGGSTAAKATPAPVATAAVASRSLRTVLAGGLIVRYSVNEQVAGHFEVLLAASTARRIGLHGAPATGLAKGTPAQIVIGKAILVTTKGGASTVKIKFSKTTANLLRRLGKVSLMVRMVVRNASPTSPATTTVLSVVTLTH